MEGLCHPPLLPSHGNSRHIIRVYAVAYPQTRSEPSYAQPFSTLSCLAPPSASNWEAASRGINTGNNTSSLTACQPAGRQFCLTLFGFCYPFQPQAFDERTLALRDEVWLEAALVHESGKR